MQRDKTRGLNFGALRNENPFKSSKVGKSLTHVRETGTLAFGLSPYQHVMSHWQLQRRGKQIFFLLWQKLPSLMMSFLTQIAELWNESNCPVCSPRVIFSLGTLLIHHWTIFLSYVTISRSCLLKKKKKSWYILNVRHPKNYFHNINLLTIWIFFIVFISLQYQSTIWDKIKRCYQKRIAGPTQCLYRA